MTPAHRPAGTSRRCFLDASLRLTASGALTAAATGLAAGCAGSTVAGPAPAAGRPVATGGPGPPTAGDLVDPDTLWSWVERMAAHGPRLTGSPAHHSYLADLERDLRGHGLTVSRHPVPLDRWLARSWSLRVTDISGATWDVPVAYYRPHSGETGPAGVTGPLVDLGSGDDTAYPAAAAAGRIAGSVVVVDAPVARLRASVLTDLAHSVHPPRARAEFAAEDYSRVWLGVPAPPSLTTARSHGAVALIEISDLSPELAAGQYTPHQQEHAGLPALRLDRQAGARLRALLAQGPARATVVLTADRDDTTVDYLAARLPGTGPGTILVSTHTDGQNALEENGCPALLAAAEYLSRWPPAARRRDVLFLFSPNHMAADTATMKPDAWLRARPDLLGAVDMALAAEHLGALGWDDQGGTAPYRPTGRSEPLAVAVGNSDLLRGLAADEIDRAGITRAGLQKPFQNGLYGEGTFTYRLGIPTVALIAGPTYLLQVTPGDNLDKLDRGLLHRHTVFLTGLLTRMLALPPGPPR